MGVLLEQATSARKARQDSQTCKRAIVVVRLMANRDNWNMGIRFPAATPSGLECLEGWQKTLPILKSWAAEMAS
jgi:hypothetical protein